MKEKIIFNFEDYYIYCDKCRNNSIANYCKNDDKVHLCKKHFDEFVITLKQNGIDNNSEKIYKYLLKIEEQRNRPKNSGLKLSSFNDYYK